MLKYIRYGSIAFIVVLAIAVGAKTFFGNQQQASRSVAGIKMGMPATLTSSDGEIVNESRFQGKPQAIHFGFTHCPDICPATLWDMQDWIETLGEELTEEIHFSMISVDPERDTPELLNAYMTAFDPRIKAYTAGIEQTPDLLKSYRIYAKKIPDETDPTVYNMDHTSSVLLLDSQSRMVGTISYMETPEVAVQKLKNLIRREQ